MKRDTTAALKALTHVVCLVGVLYLIGYGAVSSRWCFQLYRTWRFPQSQAHHLAGTLAEAQLSDDRICLLLGPSNVREAFDVDEMSQAAPELTFFNGGTSGGSIFTYQAMTELVQQSGVRPDCIVVGLNSWMLISRDLRLNEAGYTDFMDLRSGERLVHHESAAMRGDAHEQVLRNTIWPYNRVSRHLGRLMRSSLFVAQSRLSWHEPRPLDDYALWHRELGRSAQYMYDDVDPLSDEACAEIVAAYEREGMFDASRYGHPEHLAALRSVLDELMELAPHVVVIRMPQVTFGREVLEPLASEALDGVLAEYSGKGVSVLDLEAALPDSDFRDVAHLLGAARPAFSRDVAERIARTILAREAI